jgi:hypothetical protein
MCSPVTRACRFLAVECRGRPVRSGREPVSHNLRRGGSVTSFGSFVASSRGKITLLGRTIGVIESCNATTGVRLVTRSRQGRLEMQDVIESGSSSDACWRGLDSPPPHSTVLCGRVLVDADHHPQTARINERDRRQVDEELGARPINRVAQRIIESLRVAEIDFAAELDQERSRRTGCLVHGMNCPVVSVCAPWLVSPGDVRAPSEAAGIDNVGLRHGMPLSEEGNAAVRSSPSARQSRATRIHLERREVNGFTTRPRHVHVSDLPHYEGTVACGIATVR